MWDIVKKNLFKTWIFYWIHFRVLQAIKRIIVHIIFVSEIKLSASVGSAATISGHNQKKGLEAAKL